MVRHARASDIPSNFIDITESSSQSSEAVVSKIIYFTGREASDRGSKNYIGEHHSASN